MNTPKIINVIVECDVITKEVYLIAVESILKYILYQFQQIPVQLDVLERELKKEESSPEYECTTKVSNGEDAIDPSSFLKQKALERRAVIAKKMLEKKRRRWLTKVKKFVEDFQTTMKILKEEIESSVIPSTVFAVGTTPFTPKFAFKISVPFDRNCQYFKMNSHPMFPNLKRKTLLNLLRAFASNNEISKFSSSRICVTKLWTIFEKENPSRVEDGNICPASVITRPDFNISSRTKVIQVLLKEKAQPIVEMELTPCVGLRPSSDNDFVMPSVCKKDKQFESHDSFTTLNIYNKHKAIKDVELSLGPLEDGFQIISSDLDNPLPSNRCDNNVKDTSTRQSCTLPSNYFSNKHSTPVQRTPCRMVETNTNMIETPVVCKWSGTPRPVKTLSESIADIKFSPKKDDEGLSTAWYQIDFALSGFKEIFSICGDGEN